MLKTVKQTVKCRNCGEEFEINQRVAINVTMDPGLKSRVLKGSIFRYKCPHCEQEMTIINDCMYHDLEKKLMIYLMTEAKVREYKIPIGSNGFGDFGDDYKLRLESDVNKFRERIHILDTGFNDIVFEVVRAMALEQVRTAYPKMQTLYFIGVDGSDILFQMITDNGKSDIIKVKIAMYNAIADIYASFPDSKDKVNALRTIDAQWLEETDLLNRVKKILLAQQENK